MLRFALHGQDQNTHVSTCCQGKPCRSSLLVPQHSGGLGYRLPELNLPDPNDNQKGFLPALEDQVSTPGRR